MFGFNSFAAAPFSATGEAGADATVNVAGNSLTLTLDNTYTIQNAHFVNGFNLTTTLNSVVPQVAPTIASNAVTSAVGSVAIAIDVDNIIATGNTVTSAVGTVVPAQFQTIDATGQSINLATSGVQSVSADARAHENITGSVLLL